VSVDKAALFAPVLEEDDVEIPGVGSVRVRALTRLEAGQVGQRTETDARERLIISLGMVDPELTEAEAGQWMKVATAGVIGAVSVRIGQLSGLLEDSPRAAFPSDGEGPVA
jgi:hypothetical protein